MERPDERVQLITYADRLAGDLPGLAALLRSEPFDSAFAGVHILPFYTPFDGADAGFDPIDHTTVDPRLGTWDDLRDLSTTHITMMDLIVNHVSSGSKEFQDVVARGRESRHADLFLTLGTVFPDGATEVQLAAIYRPRPGMPFTPMRLGGEKRLVWTTFTPQQIDIDVQSPSGQAYLDRILAKAGEAGVSFVRLDAVGYAIKVPGTSSFMVPETFPFIEEFTQRARARGVDVLVEVHSYFRRQMEIASKVDLVYDFALPPLVLHALYTGTGAVLKHWLDIRPRNAVNVLDTHDGIGIIDVGPSSDPGGGPGLLSDAQMDELVEGIHEHSGGTSRESTGAAASNLDLYQVNCTFYEALGKDDRRYLAARAIQLFTPGIPQVYYAGALAASNDMDLLRATGVGRDINRPYYDQHSLAAALARPVVKALLSLCAFRNELQAFDGDADASLDGSVLTITRRGERWWASLSVDLATAATVIEWEGPSGPGSTEDLLEDPPKV
ncbi:sucrose phosphorylase [Demequina capsici]|uniref:Sucrose phosphorylase n=1 Tax=Demequina capsici TaxID=3075620 RepID=A0AA96F728_9MICO|nr:MULTISPECIES: sucrose phosphorylase [unclassified Demequina]WNM24804.1 sucrose phosphorylase [Demequina sp. OYTSA14]WNM27711.1 sucrose phosphorylase [Demequina sp. PMTSA13]